MVLLIIILIIITSNSNSNSKKISFHENYNMYVYNQNRSRQTTKMVRNRWGARDFAKLLPNLEAGSHNPASGAVLHKWSLTYGFKK